MPRRKRAVDQIRHQLSQRVVQSHPHRAGRAQLESHQRLGVERIRRVLRQPGRGRNVARRRHHLARLARQRQHLRRLRKHARACGFINRRHLEIIRPTGFQTDDPGLSESTSRH